MSLETEIVNFLNAYSFQNIWNEIYSEFRNNTKIMPLYERSVNGVIHYRNDYIELPDIKKAYYVYLVSSAEMHAITHTLPDETWISTEELLNKYKIQIHTYNLKGLVLNKGLTYIYELPTGNYLLAVDRKMFTKILDFSEVNNIRITTYYDSSLENDIKIKSFYVPTLDTNFLVRNKILEYVKSFPDPNKTMSIYINGYEYPYSKDIAFPTDSYVDIINDDNIIFSFDVDLTDSKQNYVYLSERDKKYKQIIHTPKHLNPDNKVLTYDSCDIFIRSKVNDKVEKGLYLHRLAKKGLTQITHNDIGLLTDILDAYRDYLKNQDVTLHVVYRQFEKYNKLLRDKNYIDLLYTESDANILKHLTGRISNKLTFWTANVLESSVYLQMMFDTPNTITEDNIMYYVDGFGFYQTLALLCPKVVTTLITDLFKGSLSFEKPYIYQNNNIFPIVYLNGKKLNASQIVYTNEEHFLNLQLKNVDYKIGDLLTLDMYIQQRVDIFKKQIFADDYILEVPYKNITVLEFFDKDMGDIVIPEKTTTVSYNEITNFLSDILIKEHPNKPGMYQVIFGPRMYGRTFVVQNKIGVHTFNVDLEPKIANADPLIIDLEKYVSLSSEKVILWNTNTVEVFLNGKYLIPKVDFDIVTSKKEQRVVAKQVFIYNVEYIKESNNKVEIIVTSAETENRTNGYIIDTQAASEEEVTIFFESMSTLHIDGYLETNVIDRGNVLQVPDTHRQGAPFEVKTSVPILISEFLKKYHPNDDNTRLAIINEYLHGKQPIYPDRVILDYSHKVYSILTATLIRDVLTKKLTLLNFDPYVVQMIAQLEQYRYLFNIDLVYNNKMDLRFIDVYPIYRQIIAPDIEIYTLLQAVIKMLLPKDDITDDTIVYKDNP